MPYVDEVIDSDDMPPANNFREIASQKIATTVATSMTAPATFSAPVTYAGPQILPRLLHHQ